MISLERLTQELRIENLELIVGGGKKVKSIKSLKSLSGSSSASSYSSTSGSSFEPPIK